MRPPAITVDFGASESDTQTRSSSEFEEIPYPSNHNWSASQNEDELPLHYMTEEKARRRVVRGSGSASVFGQANDGFGYADYDDEGKDVYNKHRHVQNRIGSGRLPQPLVPPPTTIVRLSNLKSYSDMTDPANSRKNSYSKTSSMSLQ